MLFLEEGELITCKKCGTHLFYVEQDIHLENDITESVGHFLPVKPQQYRNKFCNNCGSNVHIQLLDKVDKIKFENRKKTSWYKIPEYYQREMVDWLNRERD